MKAFILLAIVFVLELMRIRRHRIVDKLISTDTMSPESSKLFKDLDITDNLSTKILVMSGIIKKVEGDKYYLDLLRKSKMENTRPLILLLYFAIGIIFSRWLLQ